ncbi:hypothetical protein Dsin_015007 [Dipteronia sinensis]|uniref:Uncharacterized protein n=1 Tax=Dipteronia sinensis TaxID=43782 RepID=A0AAE0AP74_9ROSI|nr:hypothetical protein Dsin_015007 [Dipteronia sinensis]
MGSKNCLIAWVILLLVYVLLLTSQVAATDFDQQTDVGHPDPPRGPGSKGDAHPVSGGGGI